MIINESVRWEHKLTALEMTAGLVISALEKAIRKGKVQAGAIVHSNRGSQYASIGFRELLRETVARLGAERVGKVKGFREFASRAMSAYLFENELDFCLRLKKSHLADGMAFKQLCVEQTLRTKLRIKRKLTVLGYQMAVSVMRLSESEYLICATKEVVSNALLEYAKHWQIETLFGCLKSRGFSFEQTHLTRRTRIERLTFLLSLAFCLAVKTGAIKIREKPRKLKNNSRFERSIFRSGLDYLQNLLLNLHLPDKCREFNLLANLLSCTQLGNITACVK